MLSEIKAAEVTPQAEAITTAPVDEKVDVATEAPEAEGEQESGEKKMVDLRALHEERAMRKQTERELRRISEAQEQMVRSQQQRDHEYQVAQQRLQQLIAAQNRPAAPDPEQDPIAYTAHVARQTQEQLVAMQQQQAWEREQAQRQQQEWAQQAQAEQQKQALVQLTTSAEQEFATKQTDYQEAITFAKTRRVKELIAAGYPQDEAVRFTQNEGWQLAHQWLSQGKNPAEMGYNFAKAMGYQPKASDVDKMEMQEQGQRAAKPTGGGAVRGRPSIAQVAAMTPSQLAKMSDEDFRAAMGG